jgi:hypothetical protein
LKPWAKSCFLFAKERRDVRNHGIFNPDEF